MVNRPSGHEAPLWSYPEQAVVLSMQMQIGAGSLTIQSKILFSRSSSIYGKLSPSNTSSTSIGLPYIDEPRDERCVCVNGPGVTKPHRS